MIAAQHYESKSIKRLLDGVNAEWADLLRAANAKGERLRQAEDQKGLNRALDDAHLKLDEIQTALNSQDLGSDLRGVKDLIQKQTMIEKEMTVFEQRIVEMSQKANMMIQQGHFDSAAIKKAVQKLAERLVSLLFPKLTFVWFISDDFVDCSCAGYKCQEKKGGGCFCLKLGTSLCSFVARRTHRLCKVELHQ